MPPIEDENPMETQPDLDPNTNTEVDRVAEATTELNSTIMTLRGNGVSEDDVITALDNILTGYVGEGDGDAGEEEPDPSNPPTAAARTDPGYVRASELGHIPEADKPIEDAEDSK